MVEESVKRKYVEDSDKEIIYSKAIKAGKRIYYLDVKRNLKDDLFIAVTESKKVLSKDSSQFSFEKHKIFLYKEDFGKFMDGMQEVIDYIKSAKQQRHFAKDSGETKPSGEPLSEGSEIISDDIRFDIEF